MYKLVVCAIFSFIALTGCITSQKVNWVATGGSRADGTIRLSAEYAETVKPIFDEAQGLELAKERCSVWGYNSARAFGGTQTECIQARGFYTSCAMHRTTKEYQCTTE